MQYNDLHLEAPSVRTNAVQRYSIMHHNEARRAVLVPVLKSPAFATNFRNIP